jgi:hypothetical protein
MSPLSILYKQKRGMPSANKRAWAATKRSLTCELGSSHRAISVGKRRALVLSRCLLRWADLVLVQVTLATGCFGTSGAGRPPVQAMMGKTGGRERGRKEIHCMDRNEKEHHRSHTIVWSCEMEGDYRIHTIASICEMEGEEIFLLAELHPRYTKNSYHSR